jgi:hypothetical protein
VSEPLTDFKSTKPSNARYAPSRTKIYVPRGIYAGSKLVGTLTNRDREGFSARKIDGAHMMFSTEKEALLWLHDGQIPVERPAPEAAPVKKKLFEGGSETGRVSGAEKHPHVEEQPSKLSKPPRVPKEDPPLITEAKAKMKEMKFSEIEAWAKKVGAKYDPVAPNAGVMRMRVQNAILAELRKGA